jgi:hypothetical protein
MYFYFIFLFRSLEVEFPCPSVNMDDESYHEPGEYAPDLERKGHLNRLRHLKVELQTD